MRPLLTLLILLVSLLCSAQPQGPDTLWTYQYRGPQDDMGEDIVPTADGGFVLLMETESVSGDSTMAGLIALSSSGHVVWQQLYRYWGLHIVQTLAMTQDHGFVLAGAGPAGQDQAVLCVDSVGNPLWYRSYQIPFGGWVRDITSTRDGGYAVLTWGDGTYNPDIALLRLDANGDSLWTQRYGGNGIDWGSEIVQTSDGGFLFGAMRAHYIPQVVMQPWVVKTDSSGQIQWDRLLGTDGDEWCSAIALMSDGGCVIAGSYDPDGTLNPNHPFAARLSATGDSLWAYIWTDLIGGISSCSVMSEGCIALYGMIWTANGDSSRYFLMKVNENGDRLWTRSYYTGSQLEEGSVLAVLSDGSLAIGGYQRNDAVTATDAWAARLQAPDAVEPLPQALPNSLDLKQNFPNPFNPTTEIRFDLPRAIHTTLKVFDLLGREMAMLVDGRMNAGEHRVTFDGSGLPSGVYFYRIDAGRYSQTKKMLLLK